MEPLEPGARAEPRRPLLMDPAGARPSGFAPPTAAPPTAAPTTAAPTTAAPTTVAPAETAPQAAPASVSPTAKPAARATPTTSPPAAAPTQPAPPASAPSALAGSPGTVSAPGEAAFGPISQVIRISVRTLTSRIDLVLPDRSTFAETLETVLELAPRTLREQAIAHGGWVLRTAAGQPVPGSNTLLDEGVGNGATLFLTGIDAAQTATVYDDVADAVADTVRGDPAAWPAGGGRVVALAAAGLFAVLSCLALLWIGPPWGTVAAVLIGLALLAQVAAGLLARGIGDAGIAVVAGLFSVLSGAAGATVATAGGAALLDIGASQLLVGAAAATVLAITAALAIGSRVVPFLALITGFLVLCSAVACCIVAGLSPVSGAAIAAGLSLVLLPVVPSASLMLARFEPDLLPATAEEVAADREQVDAPDVRRRTRRAVGYLTALVQGLTWPAAGACVILAFSQDITAQVLAGAVAVGLLLRARLFITVGQRLPLLAGGILAVAALLAALTARLDGATLAFAVAAPALLAMVGCLLLAARRRRPDPSLTRAAEILEVLIAVAVVPLVAAVLGLFGFIRGLGG